MADVGVTETIAKPAIPGAEVSKAPVESPLATSLKSIATEFSSNPSYLRVVSQVTAKSRGKPLEGWKAEDFARILHNWDAARPEIMYENPADEAKMDALVRNRIHGQAVKQGISQEDVLAKEAELAAFELGLSKTELVYEGDEEIKVDASEWLKKAKEVTEGSHVKYGGGSKEIVNAFETSNREWTDFIDMKRGWRDPTVVFSSDELVGMAGAGPITKMMLRGIREKFKNQVEVRSEGKYAFMRDGRVDAEQASAYMNFLDTLLLREDIPEGDEGRYRKQEIANYNALSVNGVEIKRVIVGGLIDEDEAWRIVDTLTDDMRSDKNHMTHEDLAFVIGNVRAQLRAATSDADRLTVIKELHRRLADRQVTKLNPAEGIYRTQIDAFAGDEDAMRKMITRIISIPLKDKKELYHLGFYPQNNLDSIRQAVHDWVEEAASGTDEYKRRQGWSFEMNERIEGIHHMHNLHYMIITNQLDQFGKSASNLSNGHLQTMMKERGVADLMRISDQIYSRYLARDGMITTVRKRGIAGDKPGNFELINGYIEEYTEHGHKHERWVEGEVSKAYNAMYEVARGVGGSEEVDEFQQEFSKNVSQYMYMIFLRAHEKVAMGEVPPGPGAISRLPGGDISAMLNWYGMALTRWQYGDTSGGQELARLMAKSFQRQRKDQGWDVPLFKKIKKTSVSHMEYAAITGSHAHNRTWRERVIYLNNDPFFDPSVSHGGLDPKDPDRRRTLDGRTGILNYFDKVTQARNATAYDAKTNNYYSHYDHGHAGQVLENAFLDEEGRLKKEFNHSLGILLKQSLLIPNEEVRLNFGEEYIHSVEKVRMAVFDRAADINPVEFAYFMQGAEFLGIPDLSGITDPGEIATRRVDAEKEWKLAMTGRTKSEVATLTARRDALARHMAANGLDLYGDDKYAWFGTVDTDPEGGSIGLEAKITAANKVRLESVRKAYEEGDQSLEKNLDDILGEIGLTEPERALLAKIRSSKGIVSKELANIKFPSTPFTNDVIYESALFENAGPNAFASQFSELIKYNEVQGRLTGMFVNPGAVNPEEEFVKMISDVIGSFEDPVGTIDAQDNIYPIIEAYLKFIEQGSLLEERGRSIVSIALEQTNWKSHAKEKWFKLPTSLAQFYGGNKAPSYNVEQIDNLIKYVLKARGVRKARYTDERAENKYYGEYDISTKTFKAFTRRIKKLLGREDLKPLYTYTDSVKKLKKRNRLGSWWFKFMVDFLNTMPIMIAVGAVTSASETKEGAL